MDIDRLPGGVLRLLPLLYRNLRELEVHTPVMPRLKGLYRRTWFVNQFVLARTRDVVDVLEDAGIDTLVLKGAAIASRYYEDVGCRPMGDLDVLVSTHDVARALERLEGSGWERERYRLPPDELVRRAHGVALSDGSPVTCDLHWTVLEDLLMGSAGDPTDELWAGAQELMLGGTRTRALGLTDQLLHVVVHGARPAPEARLQWIADAVVLLRAGAIDWSRLVALAIRVHASVPVADALWYLQRRFVPSEIPSDAIAELRSMPVGPVERAAYAIVGSELGPRLGLFPVNVARYVRATRGESIGRRIVGFPRHLQRLWGLGGAGEVATVFARKAGAAIREHPGPVHGIRVPSVEGHHDLGVAPGLANGVRVDPVDPSDLARVVAELLECGHSHVVNILTVEPTVRARRDPELRSVLRAADVSLPGDAAVVAALRLAGHRPRRSDPWDALLLLARDGVGRAATHYLVWETQDGAEAVAARLESAVPGVKIVGVDGAPHGPVSAWDLAAMAERTRASGTELLWIGLGTPRQQLAADRLRGLRAAPVILTTGEVLEGRKRMARGGDLGDWLAFARGVVSERRHGAERGDPR